MATVEVDVITAGDLEIELTYVVQNARWQPLYDLRLAGANLEVTYLAQVAQNTGEEWGDVSLTLSTAQPALALLIPELEPWYIQPRMPPVTMQAARAKSAGPSGTVRVHAGARSAVSARGSSGSDWRHARDRACVRLGDRRGPRGKHRDHLQRRDRN